MFSRAPYRSTVAFRKTWLGNFQRRALAVEASAKQEGDISTVFSSLSGGESKPLDKRFALLKQHLIQGNEQKVLESWKRLLRELRKETKVVAEKRSRIIPQIQFQDVQPTLQSADSEAEKRRKAFENEVKKRGVGVITGVIPRDTAREYKYETEEYIQNNPWTKGEFHLIEGKCDSDLYRGFPPERPTVYELYFSPAQVKARAHPNLLTAQRYLMSLWHSKDPNAMISTSTALSYADRLRIRQPGDVGFTLGPHVDGGSLERWEPNGYGRGQVYDSIFAGQWEDYNPWESSCRLPAISDLYNGAGACSMFRMFQGWLSMSDTGPQEGTLLVNPLFKLATAYFLLRPFMTSLKQAQIEPSGAINSGFLHENNWMLEPETSSAIQGAGQGVCQEFNVELHPHLDLTNTMVHIPKINPGDYVVWHCDSELFLI